MPIQQSLHFCSNFSPSSSLDEKLPPAFNVAEAQGRNGEDCKFAYPDCCIAFLDIITRQFE
jgi:hypothetical protein